MLNFTKKTEKINKLFNIFESNFKNLFKNLQNLEQKAEEKKSAFGQKTG